MCVITLTGAPVVAFCHIDDKEIRLREPVMKPDALIIQDPTLLHQADLFAGLKRNGYILINTNRGFDELGLADFLKDWRRNRLPYRDNVSVPLEDFHILWQR